MSKSQKKDHILRAWRDPEYYNSLSEEERAALPVSPASIITLDDEALASITGGVGNQATCLATPCGTSHCCA